MLVAWSAPAPPADFFILSYSSSDGTDTSKVTLDGSKTRSLVQGLLPSTAYTISLITIQGDVTSEPITASLTTGELFHFSGMTQVRMNCKKKTVFTGYTLQSGHIVSSLYQNVIYFAVGAQKDLPPALNDRPFFPYVSATELLLNICAFKMKSNDRFQRLKRKINRQLASISLKYFVFCKRSVSLYVDQETQVNVLS